MATKKVKKVVKAESSVKTSTKKKACAKKKVSASKVSTTKKIKNVEPKQEIIENNNSYLIIDYPVENETIYGDTYVLRIGASADGYVEVSFNDGEWQLCRFASGYWWYDWTYFNPGDVKISARLVSGDGKVIKLSDIRKCKIA